MVAILNYIKNYDIFDLNLSIMSHIPWSRWALPVYNLLAPARSINADFV